MPRSMSLLTARQEDIDAAKRISEAVNECCLNIPFAERRGKWLAFRLSDGTWDRAVYDSKRDAVRHQSNEFQAVYVSLQESMAGMDTNAAYVVLLYHRLAYDAGFRLPDPDDTRGGKSLLMPLPKEDIMTQLGSMLNASAKGIKHYIGG